MRGRIRDVFTANELISGDVLCPAGIPTKIGQYIVRAGELVSIGYGMESGQESAQGRIYAIFKDAGGAEVPGVLRIMIESAQDYPLQPVDAWHTSALNSSATDRTKQIPSPERPYAVSQDKKICAYFIAEATATLKKADCKVLMDITRDIL